MVRSMRQLCRSTNVWIVLAKAISSFCCSAAASILLVSLSSSPGYAIPSPDLVVGSISSISQLIALLSAILGGGAAIVGVRATSDPAVANRTTRVAWRVVWIAVALLAASLAANYHQYTTQQADRQARLEAAILRPTITTDGHTLDPNLKEPTYGQQLSSPRGISTSEVERIMKEKQQGLHSDELLLDVRENAETSTGTLPGAIAVRFPDLAQAHLDFKGKTALLFCDNGNRSWQTCQELASIGIDCRFMVGGLEKWYAEHRPLADKKATSLADFRSLPPYTNKDVLLDTPDVHSLIAKGAVFVDVRYPGEFAAYHLPDAINLPIRPTVIDELKKRVATLPHRPIIAPCYDRRSCFYAQILGYEVTHAGLDYAGRYTLPWDYFVAPPPRPYIVEYLNKLHQSLWGKLVDLVATYLNTVAQYIGFLPAIILLAMISRLLVLPISLKAERDQLVSKDTAHLADDLKRRLGSDPPRLARAMRAFYRQQGLTPFRNLLALFFLPLMSISVSAIGAAAVERNEPLLWIVNAAAPDPTYVLPLIFSVLICLYLDSAFVRTSRQRILTWIGGMLVLTATGSILSAAADIYLIASAVLLYLQRAIVTKQIARLIRSIRRRQLGNEVVLLDDIERLSYCGNKAYRLGVMRAHGFPVPEGIVLTARFLDKFAVASSRWRTRQLNHIWRSLAAKSVAVRSSGSAEDNSTNSFAGVFASVLRVDRSQLENAVLEVLSSFSSAVVDGYGVDNALSNILVQRMIEPDYSGVLFTRDPACPSHSLVELVEGTAEALVSGAVAPVWCRIGRASRQPLADVTPPIDLKPLIAIGHRLEALFRNPQDIEWVYVGGRFYIVQSRDITASATGDELDLVVRSEWSRLLNCTTIATPDGIAFEQNESSEILPRPTRLSLSLMESLWASGGSIDLACRKIGISYRAEEDSPPYLVTIFGNLYVNKSEELSRTPKLSALATWRLNKLAGTAENDFTKIFLPQFFKETSLLEATDFDKLSTADLFDVIERIRRNYVFSTCVSASVVNIVADYHLKQAKAKLVGAGLSPARYLVRLNQTEFERTISDARRSSPESRAALLLYGIGHRSSLDYELAEPRYSEKVSELARLLKMPVPPIRSATEIKAELAVITKDSQLVRAVLAACSFQTLKEDAKHHSLRELAVLRRAVQAADRRLGLQGLIYQLTFEEIAALAKDNSIAPLVRSLTKERRNRELQLKGMASVGPTLTVRQLESYASGLKPKTSDGPDKAIGVRVSGSGIVEGRACVIGQDDVATMSLIPDFEDGDIVVSRMVPIAWIPYFQRAGGFVCEVGGWLSHIAIVAREFNVPLVVQAKGLHLIETGDNVRLHPDGTIELRQSEQSTVAAE
jgi:rifampicin phosphotransferase